jgi:mannosyl-3-phosphoglycerate phosphatase
VPLDNQLNDGFVNTPLISNLIVFTDLDGTLLDHETYSHTEAEPALGQLRDLSIPLILASSKTAAEIIPLRDQLGFSHCEAIVENGSGILEPHEDGSQSEGTYQRLLQVLNKIPAPLRSQYQGFADWSADDISARTGLPLADAANARIRHFSEPGLWLGSDEDRDTFVSAARAAGLTVQQGGRFLTLSFGGNKAERMMEIAKRYAHADKNLFVVALGDALNDVAMIEQADLGVIIPNPAHQGLPRLDGEADGRIIRAASAGPAGWNEVIISLLEKAAKK